MKTNPPSLLHRTTVLLYGLFAYAICLASLLYAAGFVGDFLVPKSIDSAPTDSLGVALGINALLLTVFAVQHSVMARPVFKAWLTRFVPPAAERSTYVLMSSLALILLFWQWRPIGGVIWHTEHPLLVALLYTGFAGGWFLVVLATFLIDHFDLFGLRQSWTHFRQLPSRAPQFVTPSLYRFVRHPLYLGLLGAFWCTPTMTVAHLVFALATTGYILVGIRLEERDLLTALGEDYAAYRRSTPMLFPNALARATRSAAPDGSSA